MSPLFVSHFSEALCHLCTLFSWHLSLNLRLVFSACGHCHSVYCRWDNTRGNSFVIKAKENWRRFFKKHDFFQWPDNGSSQVLPVTIVIFLFVLPSDFFMLVNVFWLFCLQICCNFNQAVHWSNYSLSRLKFIQRA